MSTAVWLWRRMQAKRVCALALMLATFAACLPTVSGARSGSTGPVERVRTAIDSVRFVAYTPTDLTIVAGRVHAASRQAIRKDLAVLREDFQGLITYSCADGVQEVPAIAASLGYRAVILGIWDPLSERELRNAQRLARAYPRLIVGISVGNETLLAERHPWPVLRAALKRLRTALPGVAITTSEPFYYYLNDDPPDFLALQDFLLPSVHPLFQPWFAQAKTAQAIDFVVRVANLLAAKTDKPVLIKETGLPSGPPGTRFNPAEQAAFWTGLLKRFPHRQGLGVAYFEAFDHGWKEENARLEFGAHPEEGYWGLYTTAREPKPVLVQLRKLWGAHGVSRQGGGPLPD